MGHVLILGGTSEARALAECLEARPDLHATLSLAGRTHAPERFAIACRSGGFGGVAGLVDYLRDHAVTAVIDATHPFAAQMTRHAADACAQLNVPRLVFTRPPWRAEAGDQWTDVPDIKAAVGCLGHIRKNVFLTVGRLSLPAFCRAPQHFYLMRSIDEPDATMMPPDRKLILARGPFTQSDEMALMQNEKIDIVVTKNSGGSQTDAKLAAARALHLPVIIVNRPSLPESVVTYELAEAFAFVEHHGRAP